MTLFHLRCAAVSQQYGYDAYKQMETVDEFVFSLRDSITRQKRQTGILFLELFRTCANNGTFCEELCDPVNKGATPWRLGQMSTSIAGACLAWEKNQLGTIHVPGLLVPGLHSWARHVEQKLLLTMLL